MNTIGVCLPIGDKCDSLFAHDLALAVAYHGSVHADEINMHYTQGSILAENRNKLCRTALENDATHIIFIDSDQRFPKDLFERLIAHDKPVVAANISKRVRPVAPTARREVPHDPSRTETVWPDKHVTGLEQVAIAGTGIMCIKAEALMATEYPWFAQPWVPSQQAFVGEDLYFCGRLKQAGQDVFIDHDLSWEIRHIGNYEFGMEDCLAEREAMGAGLWDHIKGVA